MRIRDETHERLTAMANETGESIPELLARLTEQAEDDALLTATNARFAEMRETGELAEYEAEFRGWEEGTIADGLEALEP